MASSLSLTPHGYYPDVMAGQDPPADPEEPQRPKRRRRRRRSSARTKQPPPDPTGKQPDRKEPTSPSKRRVASKKKPSGKEPKPPGPRLPTQREVSAGGVVYRRADGAIEVVLASRRTRRGDLAWGLAKGGIEPGESREDAAIREVREETGLDATIEADLGDTRYIYVWEDVRIRKRVHFFLMKHTGGDVDDRDDEMEEVRWFPLERALKRAAYRGEREVLGRAAELLR